MKRFMYRSAVRIKEFGEILGSDLLISIGLWVRDKALRFTAGDMMT
jgi:hypothetical protein